MAKFLLPSTILAWSACLRRQTAQKPKNLQENGASNRDNSVAPAHLLEIIRALRSPSRLPRRLNRRKQERDQNADDRDHDQQLDQRETISPPARGAPSQPIHRANLPIVKLKLRIRFSAPVLPWQPLLAIVVPNERIAKK
jgi:hypothetical protein